MNIGFSGCSFTFGAEMSDPIKDRYSAVIARELNINEYNVSKNGNSIDRICKGMYDLTKTVKLDFAVIQITAFSRISYAYENEILNVSLHQKHFQSDQVRNSNHHSRSLILTTTSIGEPLNPNSSRSRRSINFR